MVEHEVSLRGGKNHEWSGAISGHVYQRGKKKSWRGFCVLKSGRVDTRLFCEAKRKSGGEPLFCPLERPCTGSWDGDPGARTSLFPDGKADLQPPTSHLPSAPSVLPATSDVPAPGLWHPSPSGDERGMKGGRGDGGGVWGGGGGEWGDGGLQWVLLMVIVEEAPLVPWVGGLGHEPSMAVPHGFLPSSQEIPASTVVVSL